MPPSKRKKTHNGSKPNLTGNGQSRSNAKPPPPPPPSGAGSRLMGITELRDLIFLQMRPLDLLVSAQRVCKEWHAHITGSKELQQALFFRPVEGGIMLRRRSRSGIELDDEHWRADDDGSEKIYDEAIAANPFLHQIYLCWEEGIAYKKGATNVINRPEASGRRMLVCQPPVDSLELYCFWAEAKSNDDWYRFEDENGVKLGCILYKLRSNYMFLPGYVAGWKHVNAAEDVFRVEQFEGKVNWTANTGLNNSLERATYYDEPAQIPSAEKCIGQRTDRDLKYSQRSS